MPFLTVITRCFKRPKMLAVNVESLAQQTDQDFEQVFLVDEVGYGIAESYKRMAALGDKIKGDWVFILDDDDMLVSSTFIADLKVIVEEFNPDVILTKMDHGERGVLPGRNWHKPPVLGDIGCSAFVVRREVWQRHSAQLGAHYAGDFDFINSIFARDYEIYWFDCVASRVQRISFGAPE